jgi:reactive intermediate/imine deaminase
MKFLLLFALSLGVIGFGSPTMAGPEYVTLHGNPALPFSSAVRVGDTLYLSGDIGIKNGKLVPGGIAAEAKQTMENIKATLAHFGRDMDNIVKCQIFLADMSEWQAFNEVYVTFFKPERKPARSAFATNGLALGARAEVECIAWLGD